MQISRHYLLAFAVAACLTPSLVRAYDNEAQIRARQALEEKMNQINAQTPAPAAVPTNTAPKAAVTKPTPVAKPAPVAAPAPAERPANAQQDAMRQALQEKMNQLNAQQSAPKAAVVQPAPAPKPAAVEKPAPPVITVTPQSTTVENAPVRPAAPGYVTTPSNDSATSDKLSDALHQKMQEVGSQPGETTPAVAAQTPKYAPTQPANATVAAPATAGSYAPVPQGSTSHPNLPEQPTPQATMAHNQPVPPSASLPALSGPPSPLSATQQQKLDELLQQYRADQLSPQQYHEQRAKILSEP